MVGGKSVSEKKKRKGKHRVAVIHKTRTSWAKNGVPPRARKRRGASTPEIREITVRCGSGESSRPPDNLMCEKTERKEGPPAMPMEGGRQFRTGYLKKNHTVRVGAILSRCKHRDHEKSEPKA